MQCSIECVLLEVAQCRCEDKPFAWRGSVEAYEMQLEEEELKTREFFSYVLYGRSPTFRRDSASQKILVP
jgi:hypothetical protein